VSLLRAAGVEMGPDRVFAHRVRRLTAVSTVALGVIWGLAFADGGPAWALALLAVGWVTMPPILHGSLDRPGLRYALVLPASAVSIGLFGMVASASEATVGGWAVMTVGVLLGGSLGMWFWYRWFPVPRSFDDPFGWPRILLIGIHIALVMSGAAAVAVHL